MADNNNHPYAHFHAVGPGKQLPPSPRFHAVGPGKQLPPTVVMEQQQASASAANKEHDTTADPLASSSSQQPQRPAWTVRDAAYAILQDRQQLLGPSSKNKEQRMPVSNRFAMDPSNWLLRHQDTDGRSATTVRQAFHCAATAVLHAIQQQQQSSSMSDPAATTTIPSWEDLPSQLQLPLDQSKPPTALDALRAHSLERSFENKEYAKRKGGKTDADYVPPRPPPPAKNKKPRAAAKTDKPKKAGRKKAAAATTTINSCSSSCCCSSRRSIILCRCHCCGDCRLRHCGAARRGSLFHHCDYW